MESSAKGSSKKIPDSAIQHSLYGYKEMRLVSSEEVLSTLLKGNLQITHFFCLLFYYKNKFYINLQKPQTSKSCINPFTTEEKCFFEKN